MEKETCVTDKMKVTVDEWLLVGGKSWELKALTFCPVSIEFLHHCLIWIIAGKYTLSLLFVISLAECYYTMISVSFPCFSEGDHLTCYVLCVKGSIMWKLIIFDFDHTPNILSKPRRSTNILKSALHKPKLLARLLVSGSSAQASCLLFEES